jgi:DNA-binding XRE family transcriptional regulator
MSDFQDYLDRALRQVKLENFEDEPKHQDYDINAEVSAIIFSVRTSLGMTQKQLAEKSGVSQANISKMENGSYLPSVPILNKLPMPLENGLLLISQTERILYNGSIFRKSSYQLSV